MWYSVRSSLLPCRFDEALLQGLSTRLVAVLLQHHLLEKVSAPPRIR